MSRIWGLALFVTLVLVLNQEVRSQTETPPIKKMSETIEKPADTDNKPKDEDKKPKDEAKDGKKTNPDDKGARTTPDPKEGRAELGSLKNNVTKLLQPRLKDGLQPVKELIRTEALEKKPGIEFTGNQFIWRVQPRKSLAKEENDKVEQTLRKLLEESLTGDTDEDTRLKKTDLDQAVGYAKSTLVLVGTYSKLDDLKSKDFQTTVKKYLTDNPKALDTVKDAIDVADIEERLNYNPTETPRLKWEFRAAPGKELSTTEQQRVATALKDVLKKAFDKAYQAKEFAIEDYAKLVDYGDQLVVKQNLPGVFRQDLTEGDLQTSVRRYLDANYRLEAELEDLGLSVKQTLDRDYFIRNLRFTNNLTATQAPYVEFAWNYRRNSKPDAGVKAEEKLREILRAVLKDGGGTPARRVNTDDYNTYEIDEAVGKLKVSAKKDFRFIELDTLTARKLVLEYVASGPRELNEIKGSVDMQRISDPSTLTVPRKGDELSLTWALLTNPNRETMMGKDAELKPAEQEELKKVLRRLLTNALVEYPKRAANLSSYVILADDRDKLLKLIESAEITISPLEESKKLKEQDLKIKAQQEDIEALQKRNRKMQEQLEDLEDRLTKIEERLASGNFGSPNGSPTAPPLVPTPGIILSGPTYPSHPNGMSGGVSPSESSPMGQTTIRYVETRGGLFGCRTILTPVVVREKK